MNVGELRAILNGYPDDMPVALIDHVNDDLDTDPVAEVGVDHPGSRPDGRRSWHWPHDPKTSPGIDVLVIY